MIMQDGHKYFHGHIRYLQKATQLDRLLGPAWLAYGHSFAVENEHDQAMAAYFKVSKRGKVQQGSTFIPGLPVNAGMSLASSLHRS